MWAFTAEVHPELLSFTITRDKIPINSLDAAFMATKDIGYIKLNRFSRTTMNEFREAMNTLMGQGMKHLVLDLSYNSGGFLDVAIDLADQFLDQDRLIVYTEGNAAPVQKFNSTTAGNFKTGKLVVMINEGSASASEIVAGAIQDWDRGLLVGRRSFGKGLVQRPFDLPDGSAIRLTTARYMTPTGRSIQKPYDER
jgi:carboxyl-terminal processing protease